MVLQLRILCVAEVVFFCRGGRKWKWAIDLSPCLICVQQERISWWWISTTSFRRRSVDLWCSKCVSCPTFSCLKSVFPVQMAMADEMDLQKEWRFLQSTFALLNNLTLTQVEANRQEIGLFESS